MPGERAGRRKAGGAADAILVLVVDASDFDRACTVAGLRTAPELRVEACASVTESERIGPPDIILFQAAGSRFATSALSHQLKLAARRWPRAPTLVVADHANVTDMLKTIQAGTQGLLPSSVSVDCIRSAIQLLVNKIAIQPMQLTAFLVREQRLEAIQAKPLTAFAMDRLASLTKRQRDVLKLLAQGLSNKGIAQQLRISESTVKVHIRAIMAQNGASNRTQIVAHFLQRNGQGL